MSSIAYVTDEKMMEYHRLCGNQKICFWRLSSGKGFTHFHKGDLLFFFSKPYQERKKGFVGYAHYNCSKKMSIDSMWKTYGTRNGYETKQAFEEAIEKAAKGNAVPERLDCMELEDAVFFRSPVFPSDCGFRISNQLESYCYLDSVDSNATVKVLQKADENGIDLWSATQNSEPQNIFQKDEVRIQLEEIFRKLPKNNYAASEKTALKKLVDANSSSGNWEKIQGSLWEYVSLDFSNLTVAIPFVFLQKNKDQRVQELMGRITLYQTYGKQSHFRVPFPKLVIWRNDKDEDVTSLLKEVLHEEV